MWCDRWTSPGMQKPILKVYCLYSLTLESTHSGWGGDEWWRRGWGPSTLFCVGYLLATIRTGVGWLVPKAATKEGVWQMSLGTGQFGGPGTVPHCCHCEAPVKGASTLSLYQGPDRLSTSMCLQKGSFNILTRSPPTGVGYSYSLPMDIRAGFSVMTCTHKGGIVTYVPRYLYSDQITNQRRLTNLQPLGGQFPTQADGKLRA